MGGVVIGRERELEQARGFVDEAAVRPGTLVIAGEAGIGKSTIWSAVVDYAHALGHRVLSARPSEAETELPFAVLTDLFAAIDEPALEGLPEIQRLALEAALRRRAAPTGTVDPTAIALATLGALRALAGAGSTIVAIDDLQWVDTPSLRALTFALRRTEHAPVALVATVRTGFDSELTMGPAQGSPTALRLEIAGLG